jgi:UDP-4-amino-4,6-dideoxy-N-acetyl-beta-L-altrosamine transaminase
MSEKKIPYSKQYIDQDDIDAVINTLKSDFLTQGPKIAEFEKVFAEYVEADYALAVNNGTSALHLCALVLGVKPGDKVICPTITFAASANCISYCGGEVIFCDIDPETYLLDLDHVERLFDEHKTISGVVSVDFAGRTVNLEKLRNLVQKYNYNAWIIQDSCHSPGGFFFDSKGLEQRCGNGQYADLAIFSFHPVKHIACGEGGMITTGDRSLADKLHLLRTHGITKDQNLFINSSGILEKENSIPPWYYEMQELGYNYRLTDFQAALGISQLNKADIGLQKRRDIAKKYNEAFHKKPFVLGHSQFIEGHAYHLYVLEVENRLGLYNYLRIHQIFAQIHYIPIHLMPYYGQFGWKHGDLPNAENYYKKCISLPMYPTLSSSEQAFIIEKIQEFYEG